MSIKKQYLLILFWIVGSLSLSVAQDLKNPTLDHLIPGGNDYLAVEDLYNISWWGDLYVIPGRDSLNIYNPQTGEKEFFITRDSLNLFLPKEDQVSSLHFTSLPWKDKKQLLIEKKNNRLLFDWENKKVVKKIKTGTAAQNIDFHPLSQNVAYTLYNNLYVNDRRVTLEPEGVVCGQSVHQQEFGINKGTFWSPEGNFLAYYKMDERMVTSYPLVDVTARTGTLNEFRYPMAGMKSHKVEVGIYHVSEDSFLYLNTGDPTDRYFTNISWSPDEKSLYLIELNREQNLAKLCQYDVASGNLIRVLLEESHPKYVEPQRPIVFLPWNPDQFIYQSQKDGFNHLYLYNTQGDLMKQLTQGDWLVTELVGFNRKREEIIYSSTEQSPLESHLYAINRKGEKRALNEMEGVHQGLLSESGEYLIDRYSNPETPRRIECLSTLGKKQKHILLNAPNPLNGYEQPLIEIDTLWAADDTTPLYYRLVKPADFDPNKKYPVVIYVYGGPHAQLITKSWQWGTRGWDLYMANKGYLVFTLDNRGSANRGLNFENCTHRQLGLLETKDQMKGVEWLTQQPYVDAERIGVHGWSYGGYMTLSLLLRHPDTFKAGVAGGPVVDWKYYEIMYGERYMDTPQNNFEGYQKTDMKALAGRLKARLLLIHGGMDNICVPQHTYSFLNACIGAGTYPDLFIYPNHKHNVTGRDRVHLHELITRYFETNL